MFKTTQKIKKIFATILTSLIMLSSIQPIVLAANQELSGSGTDQFIARQYATKYQTTDKSTQDEYGIIARRMIPKSKGWKFGNGDGILVFCAEHGKSYATGNYYNGSYYRPTDEKMLKAAKVAYFGWYQERKNYGADGDLDRDSLKQYAFTQQMIWETLGQSSASFLESDIQEQYIDFKNNVNSKMQRMLQKPSFNSTNVKVEVGGNITLTDNNRSFM